jgi:hypothetical protein
LLILEFAIRNIGLRRERPPGENYNIKKKNSSCKKKINDRIN